MAAEVRGRHSDTQEHGGQDDVVAAGQPELLVDVSVNKSGVVLFDRVGYIFLGVCGGRGERYQTLPALISKLTQRSQVICAVPWTLPKRLNRRPPLEKF